MVGVNIRDLNAKQLEIFRDDKNFGGTGREEKDEAGQRQEPVIGRRLWILGGGHIVLE